jgi:hypothetical protein
MCFKKKKKINSNLNFLTLQNMQPKREDSKFKFSKRNLLRAFTVGYVRPTVNLE